MCKYHNIGIPSKGRISRMICEYLQSSGLNIILSRARCYLCKFSNYSSLEIKMISAVNIANELIASQLSFGLTGLDLILDKSKMHSVCYSLRLYSKLSLASANINVLCPLCWKNIYAINKLFMLILFKDVIISTKYNKLLKDYILSRKVNQIIITKCKTTSEAEPFTNKSDVMADVLSTGKTVKDNLLKPVSQGIILKTSLHLFYNKRIKVSQGMGNFINMLCTSLAIH